MQMKSERQKQKYKMYLIAILLFGSCVLTYYYHVLLQTGTAFSHFFYVPIILASLWWKRKGLAVAVFLAVVIVFSHYFLRHYTVTANDYFRALMFVTVGLVTALLSEIIAKAYKKTEHLNAVLRAISNVNQLITKEKDLDKLLNEACNILVETRGYYNSWVALLDESGKLIKTIEAGLGEDFLPMIRFFEHEDMTDCGRTALSQSDIVITEDPSSTCADCPLSEKYSGRGAMTIRLENEGKVYGFLSVSIAADLTAHKEEQDLFTEVARDIGYALRNIKQEKKHMHAEESLSKSEEKYRTLIQTLTDLVLIVNPDGNFTFLNSEFEKLTGYTTQDFIGRPFTEILAPEYKESTVDRFERGLSGEEIPIYGVELQHKDGKKIPVELKVTSLLDAEGKSIGRIGVARDIRDRKQAEEVLRIERDNLRNIFESIEDGIYIVNRQYDILYVNPILVKDFGPYEGVKCYRYLHDRDEVCPWCKNQDVWARKTVRWEWYSFKNDRTYDLMDTPLTLPDGSIGKLEVFRDITAQKQAEQEKKKLETQLRQAQKMEAIGTLAGGIAHDFNNILFPIMGYAEMGMIGVSEDSKIRKNFIGILNASKRAGDLVQQILTFSRQHEQELKPLKAQLVVKEALNLIRSSIPSTIEIDQDIEKDCNLIMADPTQIHQVVMNLCTNAYHAMEETGGSLGVNLEEIDLTPEDLTGLDMEPGPYLCLTVSNTGTGMDSPTMERIFIPTLPPRKRARAQDWALQWSME